jgi:hypothetical protein
LIGNGTDSISTDTNLHWDTTNDRLGIKQTTPEYEIDTTGDIRATGIVRADGGLTTGVTTLVPNLNADLLDS